MAISNGNEMVMPVAPIGINGGGMGGGFGNSFGGDWGWIILLLLIAGGGWGGFGGFGGGAGSLAADGAMLYPWMNQANLTQDGFQNQMLNDNVTSIRDGINSLSTQLCSCCCDMRDTVSSGFYNAEIAAANRQMANMNQAFAAQTATAQGFNNVQAATADLKYTVATENCADRQTINEGVRDIIASQTASTQRILDQLCADKIEQKNDTINQLRSELLYARGQASQDVQTAAIQLGQRNLANEVEQYVAPRAVPAYIVQNPNCCTQTACGCGAF